MILMSPVSCASDDFYFYCVVCFYIFYHRTNKICSMTSLTNLGLTPDPLVRTIFALFICVLTSMLLVLVFWSLLFFTKRSQFQRWLTPFIILALKFLILPPNFKISFIVIVRIFARCISKRCSFSKI